ncbi:ribosome small subunit-dependent GTPase A [Heliophilum fasciatum]|uniref:Small ribosomal subunit biogenesis GTPase RsgA n=1 Tax=Heliophilum fasciatum TaxID=35700 RepID=A0A4R2RXC0_9FIRM|nr:ribosome small subunit-dependent GTPase A [Heliophilum fasciatum]MCW2277202.1 ribosome biogenesis GTPase [Heliophilum fasciatum]TCP68163.1 ribosome biogenesis GTPase [Heliophilum fasciatum]
MREGQVEGTIIKGYSGFYYVQTAETLYTCSLRGKFRLQANDRVFLVGDRVRLTVIEKDRGVIDQVMPRRNELLRPAIANVDQVLLVFALAAPEPDFGLLDRMLLLAFHEGIRPVILWNKADQVAPEVQEQVQAMYRASAVPQFLIAAREGLGIDQVRPLLTGAISVLAGPSGAGKSTLLNALEPGLTLKTGDVSAKIGRGRHTTRHVELMKLASGALIADTPGFSTLYLPDIPEAALADLMPEITALDAGCRYTSCLHVNEPDCAVKRALEEGRIHPQRYRHYVTFLQEMQEQKKRGPKGKKP